LIRPRDCWTQRGINPRRTSDDRPDGLAVDLIVIHGISLPPGEFGGPWIDALFTNTLDPAAHPYFQSIAPLRVSAHLLIGRDGKLVQFVPFHRRAWHAGASEYAGRSRCNDFSVGIELEGADHLPYDDRNIYIWRRWLSPCGMHTQRLLLSGWSAMPTSRQGRKTDPGSLRLGAAASITEPNQLSPNQLSPNR
jgi:AmpD protein